MPPIMKEYLSTILKWSQEKQDLIIARVIATWGSSPRPVGSVMIINSKGQMTGSISGGCVEGEVVKEALRMMDQPGLSVSQLSFGISNDEAWQVGLSCGGEVSVLLQKANINDDAVWQSTIASQEENKSGILISEVKVGNGRNSFITESETVLGNPLSDSLMKFCQQLLVERRHQLIDFEENQYFIQTFPRQSQLIIIGAAHITVDLVTLGNMYGFETIVIDPRGYFIDHTTFNDPPHQLINAYPSEVLKNYRLDQNTYCAILSHDPKIDDDALPILLPKKLGYLGALGSRKTHSKRVSRLLEKGYDQTVIDQIRAPIGVSIKAQSAREIALSIIAEIIEAKNHFQ